jgi:hypothetical protein
MSKVPAPPPADIVMHAPTRGQKRSVATDQPPDINSSEDSKPTPRKAETPVSAPKFIFVIQSPHVIPPKHHIRTEEGKAPHPRRVPNASKGSSNVHIDNGMSSNYYIGTHTLAELQARITALEGVATALQEQLQEVRDDQKKQHLMMLAICHHFGMRTSVPGPSSGLPIPSSAQSTHLDSPLANLLAPNLPGTATLSSAASSVKSVYSGKSSFIYPLFVCYMHYSYVRSSN